MILAALEAGALEVVGFGEAVRGADWAIAGEGSLDAQSLAGNSPVGVARAARADGARVVAMAGRCEVSGEALREFGVERVNEFVSRAEDVESAQRDADRPPEAVAADFALTAGG